MEYAKNQYTSQMTELSFYYSTLTTAPTEAIPALLVLSQFPIPVYK